VKEEQWMRLKKEKRSKREGKLFEKLIEIIIVQVGNN